MHDHYEEFSLMKVAHYSYVLECKHTAVANIPENDTLTAYKKGDSYSLSTMPISKAQDN